MSGGFAGGVDRVTWIQTRSGRAFDLLDPKPEQVDIGDIAFALATLPRFTGHVRGYSVAEHSVFVSVRVNQLTHSTNLSSEEKAKLALGALLHDAHEAYIGDLSSPLKQALRSRYPDPIAAIERPIIEAIAQHVGLDSKYMVDDVVKRADLEMLAVEHQKFFKGLQARPWHFPHEAPQGFALGAPWSPGDAEKEFRKSYEWLCGESL